MQGSANRGITVLCPKVIRQTQGQKSSGAKVLGGKCPGGGSPAGKCPAGKSPRAISNIYDIAITYS